MPPVRPRASHRPGRSDPESPEIDLDRAAFPNMMGEGPWKRPGDRSPRVDLRAGFPGDRGDERTAVRKREGVDRTASRGERGGPERAIRVTELGAERWVHHDRVDRLAPAGDAARLERDLDARLLRCLTRSLDQSGVDLHGSYGSGAEYRGSDRESSGPGPEVGDRSAL